MAYRTGALALSPGVLDDPVVDPGVGAPAQHLDGVAAGHCARFVRVDAGLVRLEISVNRELPTSNGGRSGRFKLKEGLDFLGERLPRGAPQ